MVCNVLADNSVIWSSTLTVGSGNYGCYWLLLQAYFTKLGNNLKVFTSCVDAECSRTIGQTLAIYGLFGTCKV